MPRSTSPQYIGNNAPINKSLVNTKPNELTTQRRGIEYTSTALGTLQNILFGLKSKTGRELYKTLQKCGNYSARGEGVIYKGYSNGKIRKSGVIRCKNPECPNCSPKWASEKVCTLSKALTAYNLSGGEMAFITITQKPTKDTAKGIQIMLDLKAKLHKRLQNRSRGLSVEEKGIGYIAIEKTLGSKWAYTDESGNNTAPFAYLHTHLHCLVGTKRKGELEEIIQEFRAITKDGILGSGGWGLYETVKSSQYDDKTQKPLKDRQAVGFDVKYLDDTEKMSSYLNKAVSLADQTALEMNYEGNKQGIGMGLWIYLDRLHKSPNDPLLQAHKSNLRSWFKILFGKGRTKEFNLEYWVKKFEELQHKNARLWLDQRGYGEKGKFPFLSTTSAFSETIALYEGWENIFVDNRIHPVGIEENMQDKAEVVWKEVVCRKLYRSFNRFGMESTLEHLFKVYHFDGQHKECYDCYTEVNTRYSPVGQHKLVGMLKEHGLLRGSRVRN